MYPYNLNRIISDSAAYILGSIYLPVYWFRTLSLISLANVECGEIHCLGLYKERSFDLD